MKPRIAVPIALLAALLGAGPALAAPPTLEAKVPGGVSLDGRGVMGAIALNVRHAGRTANFEFALARATKGRDHAGPYTGYVFTARPGSPGRAMEAGTSTASLPGVRASVELRRYDATGVITSTLDYHGPAPDPEAGLQVVLPLADFGRGMALHRYRPFWTSPVFASDHRLLPDHNVLLLWQRTGDRSFELLAPLGGHGVTAEVGTNHYQFGVTLSSHGPWQGGRVPLFVYAAGDDPYKLPKDAYTTAFANGNFYGRLRWQKAYPAIYRKLGWCSWNAYYDQVSADKLVTSAASLKRTGLPVGYMLIDDGWLALNGRKLAGYDATPAKFPGGLAPLVKKLKHDFGVPHVGVWHAFQGYWDGVDPGAAIARGHTLARGRDGLAVPDPNGGSERFFDRWYHTLHAAGIDFVKVDDQGNMGRFTDGVMPRFAAGAGIQRGIQEAARRYFGDVAVGAGGVNFLNCMALSPEDVLSWRYTNLARSSNDYEPDDPTSSKRHLYENAYNTYWVSNFAYPDYDMFVSDRPDAEYHAIARAISGGPAYIADRPGQENVGVIKPLCYSDGQLLQPDEPAQVTPDLLLVDTGLTPVPLELFGTVRRPGYFAAAVASFNANRMAEQVTGAVRYRDVPGMPNTLVAAYQWRERQARLLADPDAALPIKLGKSGADLVTLAPVVDGAAVFGLIDKYLGAAAVESVTRSDRRLTVRLREAGDFGAWLSFAPRTVEVDGRALPESTWSRERRGLFTLPRMAFGPRNGPHVVTLAF